MLVVDNAFSTVSPGPLLPICHVTFLCFSVLDIGSGHVLVNRLVLELTCFMQIESCNT